MSSSTRASKRAVGNHSIFQPRQDFWRGADNFEVAQVHKVHIGRWIEAAQGSIEVYRWCLEGNVHSLGKDHLHDVACLRIVSNALHGILKSVFSKL